MKRIFYIFLWVLSSDSAHQQNAAEQAFLNSQEMMQLRKCQEKAKVLGSGRWNCSIKIPV